jgi:hypothetical protein
MKQNLEKVKKDILERSIQKNFCYLPNMGDSCHEYNYTFYSSSIPDLKGYTLIVSKKLFYHNSSLVDYKKMLYVYDENGEFIGGNEMLEKYPDLFKTLLKLNESLS